jgi:hypothetical protein
MNRRPPHFDSYIEILDVLVKLVVDQVKSVGHDYERHLDEAMERIDEELYARHVGAELREDVTSIVWNEARNNLDKQGRSC